MFCHASHVIFKLQPPNSEGVYSDQDSQQNYKYAMRVVDINDPGHSLILIKLLDLGPPIARATLATTWPHTMVDSAGLGTKEAGSTARFCNGFEAASSRPPWRQSEGWFKMAEWRAAPVRCRQLLLFTLDRGRGVTDPQAICLPASGPTD